MSDAVTELAHDHAELNRQVLSLSAALRRLEPETTGAHLEPALGELCDMLFAHFAREEEGLFPFVADVAPDLEPQVKAMLVAHDAICGALSRMVYLAATAAPVRTMLALFDRFENAYAEHSSMETALLVTLDRALAPAQRASLDALVASL